MLSRILTLPLRYSSPYELAALPGAKAARLAVARRMFSLADQSSETWRPIVDDLSQVTAPTLVIWGKQDRLLPVAHAQVAKERMPNVQLHAFDGCGHAAHVERAAEFSELVLEFLAE